MHEQASREFLKSAKRGKTAWEWAFQGFRGQCDEFTLINIIGNWALLGQVNAHDGAIDKGGCKMALRPRGIRRKIDDWGRIVLPKNMLAQFGVGPKDEVEIYATQRGFFISVDVEGEKVDAGALDRIESVEM